MTSPTRKHRGWSVECGWGRLQVMYTDWCRQTWLKVCWWDYCSCDQTSDKDSAKGQQRTGKGLLMKRDKLTLRIYLGRVPYPQGSQEQLEKDVSASVLEYYGKGGAEWLDTLDLPSPSSASLCNATQQVNKECNEKKWVDMEAPFVLSNFWRKKEIVTATNNVSFHG